LTEDAESWFKGSDGDTVDGLCDADIDDLIEQRKQARVDKNWVEADRLRDVLNENKIIIEDGSGETCWRRA
jgi:cysteinyl-tRNA synthetase